MKQKTPVLKTILLLLAYGVPALLISQEKSAVDSYVDYFKLPRESLFIHTNKTVYLTGEEAWFKIYAYDRRSQLASKATTNIHLGLYDSKGNMIDHKLFLAQDGTTHGSVEIDSTFSSGNYYLKASTNWMRNFKEDDTFIQKIRVINFKEKAQNTNNIAKREYDFQLLPEGGHILSEVKNSIGIKMIDDQGLGTQCAGVVMNAQDEKLVEFKTNRFGIGRFSFFPKDGEKYLIEVKLPSGKTFQQPFPEIKKNGLIIRVNNLKKEEVGIDFTTNQASWSQVKSTQYKMFIHKDGDGKVIPVKFNNPTEKIVIARDLLFQGVNTITLFDAQENPIVERMFYNGSNYAFKPFDIQQKSIEADSVIYQLNTKLKDSLLLTASISVLPAETKSYAPRHNIISALLLKPYLKGTIENPKYYFEKQNRKRAYELDLLLLTQGWSRYEWNNIFNNPPDGYHAFEDGFRLNGGINTDLSKIESLLLFPTKLNSSTFIDYDSLGKFSIPNFYPTPGEELRFSVISKRGKAERAYMAANVLIPPIDKNPIDITPFQDYRTFYADKNNIPPNFLTGGREVLDEIVLDARLDIVFKKLRPFKGDIIKVTDSLVKQHVNLQQVFQSMPMFRINFVEGSTPGAYTDLSITYLDRPLFMHLDGVLLPYYRVHNLLISNTALFEDIYVDLSSNIYYPPGSSRPVPDAVIVHVFSRISEFDDLDLMRAHTNKIKITKGFERQKTFYTPRYVNYKSPAFKDYGVIHWEPNITLTKDQVFKMKMIHTKLEKLNFYVEGITSDGRIFSQVIQWNKNSQK